MGSEVRSNDLDTSLSSSAGMAGVEMDTATSVPSSVPSSSCPSVPATPRTFYTLKEECSLKVDTFSRFKDRFQIPDKARACLPRKGEKACAFVCGKLRFYEAAFTHS